MASLSRSRDHSSLLGHSPRDPFASAGPSPFASHRYSDVDFSDVFGGPPRRTSAVYCRRGSEDTADARGGEEDEIAAPRRPGSSSFGEMPVFGGSIESPARWRQAGDGFFDDIFRVNEMGCSTPRKVDRDVFSSNPSSRVLSPSRPLPPASDAFGRGSAFSSQLSFSTASFQRSDDPACGSHSPDIARRNEKSAPDVRCSSPVASAAGYRRLVQTKHNPKGDMHATLSESVLPYKTAHSKRMPSEAINITNNEAHDSVRQLKKDSFGEQTPSENGYFHFSMHKWASIDVTLVMPHNLRERAKSGTRASGLLSVHVLQSADALTDKSVPQGHRNVHAQCDLKHTVQLNGTAAEENCGWNLASEEKKNVLASPDTGSVLSHTTDISGNEQRIGQTRKEDSKSVNYSRKENDVHGTANVEQSKYPFGSQTSKYVKMPHGALASTEDKMVGSRVKGQVKNFIKIFNQEPAPRSEESIEHEVRKLRTRNEVRGGLDGHIAHADGGGHNKEKVGSEAHTLSPMMVKQNVEIEDAAASDQNSSMKEVDYSSTELGHSANLEASFSNVEEAYFGSVDESLVEDNDDKTKEVDSFQDEIKKSDTKIREWSRGKEMNIRSLLSTLQYVLWPGSGWKPVPLVDIIEGASVRRAYQKALLCLHPDKLQQKGAEAHQKYIAEKVFDILQEAWIQFSSTSPL